MHNCWVMNFVSLVIFTGHIVFVVAKKKSINCDERHMNTYGAHFLTDSIFQLGLDSHRLDPPYQLFSWNGFCCSGVSHSFHKGLAHVNNCCKW